MQLEQEYEEKQMVIHEKHDLEGLIATLCDQVHNTQMHTHTQTIFTLCHIYFSCVAWMKFSPTGAD